MGEDILKHLIAKKRISLVGDEAEKDAPTLHIPFDKSLLHL